MRLNVLYQCNAMIYVPGDDHEHYCLASTPHEPLAHTCKQCQKTWPQFLAGHPDALLDQAAELVTAANQAEAQQ